MKQSHRNVHSALWGMHTNSLSLSHAFMDVHAETQYATEKAKGTQSKHRSVLLPSRGAHQPVLYNRKKCLCPTGGSLISLPLTWISEHLKMTAVPDFFLCFLKNAHINVSMLAVCVGVVTCGWFCAYDGTNEGELQRKERVGGKMFSDVCLPACSVH